MFRCKIILALIFIYHGTASLKAAETVSILNFDNTAQKAEHEWLRKGLAVMLTSDLMKCPDVQMVERENLQTILKEHALAQSGVIDETQAVQIGKLLHATLLVYGSFRYT